ncbi:hypothetical protein NCER_101923 [Vairimorpha ceranae BRL01]|uniref:triacylglycerol lipase n=2 Tax=Vairimorpha ceranae TaxID=40302 RepID=C4VB12_VAIC1|nr:lipase [Vairimorpha ceranae]EEQ81591.1 hypothetical protein NCER_101923 [Vairimorpha ceranae BRL01]KKO75966.1 lipase [Vairimorpha ceranae]
MDINFLIHLLEMSINTYHVDDLPSLIYKFGYKEEGVRCKLFGYKNKLVLAIKGTSLNILGYELGETSLKDKKMVNVLFNKCKTSSFRCEYSKKVKFDKLGYLHKLQRIIVAIQYLYPNKEIILTGHSLGGALASLLSLIYNLQCITFASPGEFYISKILQLNNENGAITHYGMCNDTIFTGKCDKLCNLLGYSVDTSRHNGKVYCLKITPNIKSVVFHNSSVLLSYFRKLALSKKHTKNRIY